MSWLGHGRRDGPELHIGQSRLGRPADPVHRTSSPRFTAQPGPGAPYFTVAHPRGRVVLPFTYRVKIEVQKEVALSLAVQAELEPRSPDAQPCALFPLTELMLGLRRWLLEEERYFLRPEGSGSVTQCQVCCSAAQEGTAGRPDFKALPSTHSLRSAARGGDKDGPLPNAGRDGRGSKRAEVPLGTAEEEPFRQGPLGGQEQGVLGETRRKVLEIMCPREGKEQDQNTLRGTCMTQRRAEWKRAPHQLPAPARRPPALLSTPCPLAHMRLGQVSVPGQRPLGAWPWAGRGRPGLTTPMVTLLWGADVWRGRAGVKEGESWADCLGWLKPGWATCLAGALGQVLSFPEPQFPRL